MGKDKDRAREYQKIWRLAHPGYTREWNVAHRESKNESVRKWRAAHPDHATGRVPKRPKIGIEWRAARYEKDREWRLKNPGVVRANQKKWFSNNPEKVRAHYLLNNAVRDGRVIRPEKCLCGAPNPEGHHEDYSKPLDVLWRCPKCHKRLKREVYHARPGREATPAESQNNDSKKT